MESSKNCGISKESKAVENKKYVHKTRTKYGLLLQLVVPLYSYELLLELTNHAVDNL